MFFVLFNCSEREHLNPLDPDNPETGGAPQNIQIYSYKNKAVISWRAVDVNTLEKYYIYRSKQDSTELAVYDSVGSNQTNYEDLLTEYDQEYYYAIQAVTETDMSRKSRVVSTVAGKYNFLIADFQDQQILEISYDGKHVVNYLSGISVTGLSKLKGKIYATNLWDRKLQVITESELATVVQINAEPVEVTANRDRNLLYVLNRDTDNLISYTEQGDVIEKVDLQFDITFNSKAAYDSINKYIWVTNRDSNTIHYYNFVDDSSKSVSATINSPNEIEIDKQGGCWIASGEGVIRIDNNGKITKYLNNYYIYDISMNFLTGDIYYSGFLDGNYYIGYLNTEGENNIVFENEYKYIAKIKCVPDTPRAGLLMVDGSSGDILRVNATGKKIGNSIFVYSVEDIILK